MRTAIATVFAFQFQGKSSSILLTGMSAMRASTSASQACGSMSLSLAVYADRRTMPNEQVYANVFRDKAVAGSA
jgi:hypothetical protein